MPFGTYKAVCTAHSKIKESKLPKKKTSSVDAKAEPSSVPVTEQVIPIVPRIESTEITILIAARTVAAAQDFIAGLHMNMSTAVSNEGLAFYSNDNIVIQDLLNRQHRLSNFFRDNSTSYRLEPAENDGIVSYLFFISRSGMQQCSYKINILCATAETIASNLPHCDIVWLLTDAPFYLNENHMGSYGVSLISVAAAAEKSNRPVYILAAQFERSGKIRDNGSCCSVEKNVYTFLTDKIKSILGELAEKYPVFPVQIYGGLSYKETDSTGVVVFEENRFGGLSIYKPAGCYIPLLYAIEKIFSGDRLNETDILNSIRKMNRTQRLQFSSDGIETGD